MEIEEYMVSTDQQLVSLVLGGDTTAFEHLFNRYRDSIFRLYLQRTGGSADDADDILQETFVKIYLNLHKYDSGFTFGQWVYTIARNTFIDYLRRRRDDLSIDTLPGNAGWVAPASTIPTPEESYITFQQRAQLESHLRRMTPRYRSLIELRFFRELSFEEIADELRIPVGTVKTQIHRAREQLCKLIIDSGMM